MTKIPFIGLPDKPITSTTQKLIPIADIVDGIVIYKNGGAALLMETTSLNFGLLSEREQGAVIASYAATINSLTFPIQIVVRSQRKDISNYITLLSKSREKITNPKLGSIMDGYKNYIEQSIKKKNVLSKKFYVVVPFTQYELGVAKSMMSTFRSGGKEKTLPFTKAYVIRKAKITLIPKRDHLMRQMGRLGVVLRQLTNTELIDMYYEIYNPVPPVKDKEVFDQA